MEIIKTVIPFNKDNVDEYIENDNLCFLIDFNNSQYKGKQLLNYIYNSGINADIIIDSLNNEISDLLLEYIRSNKINNISILNRIWTDILFKYLYEEKIEDEEYNKFINNFIVNNENIIKELVSILSSLKIFLLKILFNENNNYSSEKIKEFNIIGNNFISLRNSEKFWELFDKLDEINIETNEYSNFTNNSFDGYKVSKFFLYEFNPLGIVYMLSNSDEQKLNEIEELISNNK